MDAGPGPHRPRQRHRVYPVAGPRAGARLRGDGYPALWRWSVTDLDGFWQAVWDYCGIEASAPPTAVLGRRSMPGAEWFPGRQAELRAARAAARAARRPTRSYHQSETTPLAALSWPDLAGSVRVLATRLRAMGVRPGDRVVSCMPNIPQTVIAMLATTSIGAVWTSCSPDFGGRGVHRQVRAAVAQGAVLRGRLPVRRPGLRPQRRDGADHRGAARPGAGDPPYPGPPGRRSPRPVAWDEVMDHPPVPAPEFEFEQVPFGHPLWVLFSSGTTGLPKAITHSHGGILIEQLKLQTLPHGPAPRRPACSSSPPAAG